MTSNKTTLVSDSTVNTSVNITRKRMNGLILMAAQQNRPTRTNMLDFILDEAGVHELTFEELIEKAKTRRCLERARKLLREGSGS